MKITAAIGVIDEVECLEYCVDHHSRIGVDSFVITDLGSTDGTRDVLKRLALRSNVRVLEGGQNMTRTPWPQAMLECAYECFHPDYILYADADEFWLPSSGTLHAEDYAEYDIIESTRYNVIPDSALSLGDWGFGNKKLEDRIVFKQRTTLSPDNGLDHRAPVVRHTIAPKVMYRAKPATCSRGWHSVTGESLNTIVRPKDLVVVHFPFSTYERFLRKVENTAVYLAENKEILGSSEAWHWRLWVRAYHDGRLRETYESQVFPEGEISLFLKDGIACKAGELFHHLV
jgi:hypothetical protein